MSDIQRLLDAYAMIKQMYVGEVDDKKLFNKAIQGMVSSLDPHSEYLEGEDFKRLYGMLNGEYVGIGVETEAEETDLRVVSTIEGSPAYAGGVQAGDLIESINGIPVAGMRPSAIAKQIFGEVGTPIALQIRSGSTGQIRKVELKRAKLPDESVSLREVSPGIGCIRIARFQRSTPEELASHLLKLQQQGKTKGLILDLRDDPGGLVPAAIGTAAAFLPKDSVVLLTKGRDEASKQALRAEPANYLENDQPDPLLTLSAWTRTVPIIVLVNGGTASSAEILAGALQDAGRAKVVGTRTFGKGTIQAITPLTEESSIRLSIARYYTPRGRPIQSEGITPDVVVTMKGGPDSGVVRPIREIDLPGHLPSEIHPDATGNQEDIQERPVQSGSPADVVMRTALGLLSSVLLP